MFILFSPRYSDIITFTIRKNSLIPTNIISSLYVHFKYHLSFQQLIANNKKPGKHLGYQTSRQATLTAFDIEVKIQRRSGQVGANKVREYSSEWKNFKSNFNRSRGNLLASNLFRFRSAATGQRESQFHEVKVSSILKFSSLVCVIWDTWAPSLE